MVEGKKKSKSPAIPAEATEHLCNEILAIGDRGLEVSRNGRFCYVYHGGSPLCRLGYRGEVEIWDFAIYKYSSNRYSDHEFGFPSYGKVADLVRDALSAYNLR
jgi:hypothetical protein